MKKKWKQRLIIIAFFSIILAATLPFILAQTQLFYEDWEAGDFNDWSNSNWAIATDRKQGGSNSVWCDDGLTCDMYTTVSIDTSSASQVNVVFGINDDDCDPGDVLLLVNDSGGNWDGWNIDAGSLGGNDNTWYTITLTLTDAQYFHSGFIVRFQATPDSPQEHFWVDNINVSINYTDTVYPQFSNYWDDNATLQSFGVGHFNVTVENTNGTVLLDINGENITATNLTSNIYNASYNFSKGGVYPYTWHSWGNGTSENYNKSVDRSYTVNISYGWLNVSISKPDDNSNWSQYDSNLIINANVTCEGSIGDICGTVYALARYNLTANPDTFINETEGDLPFYILKGSNWWNASWEKRKVVEIRENSGSELTNYSVLINVTYDSDMMSNFSDLRFISFDGTIELDYWIENKTDGSSVQVWVEFSTLTADIYNTFYMYFNNSLAVSKSNITETFLFGDDFDDEDVSDWNQLIGGTSTCSLGSTATFTYALYEGYKTARLYAEGAPCDLYSYKVGIPPITANTARARMRAKIDDCGVYDACENAGDAGYLGMAYTNESTPGGAKNYVSVHQDIGRFVWGTAEKNVSDTWTGTNFSLIGTSVWPSSHITYFDWILYRKYVSLEPTYSILEENERQRILNYGESWNVTWTLNVTTASKESYLIDVLFNSSYGSVNVSDNNTADRQVNLNPLVTDTCTYSGSGTWNVDCSDYCNITSTVNIKENNITIIGTGKFIVNVSIYNWTNLYIAGTDINNRCLVYSIQGGGFDP